jgi:hypothetical protein
VERARQAKLTLAASCNADAGADIDFGSSDDEEGDEGGDEQDEDEGSDGDEGEEDGSEEGGDGDDDGAEDDFKDLEDQDGDA